MKQITNISKIIFALIQEKSLGKTVLMKILKGSKEKDILANNYHLNKCFGALYWLSEEEITCILDKLLKEDYLRYMNISDGLGVDFPVFKIHLTEKASVAIDTNKDIPFGIPEDIFTKYHKLSETIMETYKLFKINRSVEDVALKRNLKINTIYDHLEDCILHKIVAIEEVISEEKRDKMKNIIQPREHRRLSELKQLLPKEISYNEIKCYLASLRAKMVLEHEN
ncbi:helix-turn-helix domain-containing protein [Candidatus Woesearchaeota archaeon]|nr:helix-turn-helix domain-containing protein [Candidatus Woesearchaeota archaeon]